MTHIRMCCQWCGSTNVFRDAAARWNETTQGWEVQAVYDDATCDDCEETTSLDEVEIGEAVIVQGEVV